MRISKKTKKAMDEAERKVREEASKPKERRKRRKNNDVEQPKSPTSKWIEDRWGNQGEVFFDGYNYWGTFIRPSRRVLGVSDVISGCWSPEEWEKRKNEQDE